MTSLVFFLGLCEATEVSSLHFPFRSVPSVWGVLAKILFFSPFSSVWGVLAFILFLSPFQATVVSSL